MFCNNVSIVFNSFSSLIVLNFASAVVKVWFATAAAYRFCSARGHGLQATGRCSCAASPSPHNLLWNVDLYRRSDGLMDFYFSLRSSAVNCISATILSTRQRCSSSKCVCVCVWVCGCLSCSQSQCILCNHWIQGSMLGFAWTVNSD